MPAYICVTKCFWQDRLWNEGDELTWTDENSTPPHHFTFKDRVVAEKAEVLKTKEQEIDDLRKELDKRGISFDMRYGKAKLEEVLRLAERDKKEITEG